MVNDNLSNLPHHGNICKPRTMVAMTIFGRIPRPHQPEPLNKVLDKSGSAGFCETLIFNKVLNILLQLSCQIIRSCHQQGMVVVMAIDDGFDSCYFTDCFLMY